MIKIPGRSSPVNRGLRGARPRVGCPGGPRRPFARAPSPGCLPGTPASLLAGSIEGGRAEPWQGALIHLLADSGLTILDPRRDDWDASWVDRDECSPFPGAGGLGASTGSSGRTGWRCTSPRAPAPPVTLLELGLVAASKPVVVCCPEGFWRKGNVDAVCRRFGIPQVDDLAGLATALRDGARSER